MTATAADLQKMLTMMDENNKTLAAAIKKVAEE